MKEATNGSTTRPVRPVGWSGASAITFGIAFLEFVKEMLVGETLAHAAFESSVFVVGGLVLGLVAIVANRRTSGTRTQ